MPSWPWSSWDFLLYPLERGTPPPLATLLAVGLLVGGAVATAFVLEPLGRIVGALFERFFGATDRWAGPTWAVTGPGPGSAWRH